MITIGADRFRSKAAASPEFGAGSGGNVNDIYKQLEAINETLAEMRPKLEMIVEVRAKLETVLPHLATKAELAPVVASSTRFATKHELQAMRSDLIAWIVGTALTSLAVLAGLMTLASRLSWN